MPTHRIRRQILDLELPRTAGAVELQRQAGRVFREQVLPRLESVFGKLAPADRFIRIDRLEIDLGRIGEAQWEREFVERCIREIDRQIREATGTPTASGPTQAAVVQSPREHALAIFRYFLETGRLPWHAGTLSLKILESQLVEIARTDPTAVQAAVLPGLKQRPAALRRLVWQFSPAFSNAVIEAALALPGSWIAQALQIRQNQTGQTVKAEERIAFLQQLLDNAAIPAQQPPFPELVAQLFFQTQPAADNPPPPAVKPGVRKKNPPAGTEIRPEKTEILRLVPDTPADEGIFIDHAGLVLLGAYLPGFFAELQLTIGPVFRSGEARLRAIHVLHFLATGTEQPEEPALTLPKLLCGLPLDEPVPPGIELTPSEKTEAQNLLEAAVRNWPALKNTSADGLRTGFLQRQGLLTFQENQNRWLLQIERLGRDMLLERLPWTYSLIKMPWLNTAIQVEW
ncbi:MAG: contractile injection system tape measure protein [Saprospiraceae bacterium]